MVKARLSHPVPMAELLKVLSQWKQQPQPGDSPASQRAPEAPPWPRNRHLQQLSEQLARLEQKVDRLTDLLLDQKPD